MSQTQSRRIRVSLPKDRLTAGLLVLFAVLAIATAVVAFIFVKNFVSSWSMSRIGGEPIPPAGQQNPSGTEVVGTPPTGPLQSDLGPTPQPWDGVSRVNILVMGLDYADTEARRTPRSDTMILFTIDPLSKSAGMLTIPRDMWVNIPDHGYAKINTAFYLGELEQLPGGGPGLAMRTVEEFIGVPIHYYAQIDFYAFTEFIDNIRGIEVDVPYEIKVDPVGPGNTVILQPGKQLLGGAVSLAYARNRYTEGDDFDRSNRQMQVIMAIRDKIVSLDMLPTLIQRAPAIYQQLSVGIHTNLTLQQAIQLALLAKDINREDIKRGAITPNEVSFGKSPDGLDILKPITDKIRLVRDEIFTTGGPVSPSSVNGDITELAKGENARILIQNGTQTPGLGGRTTDYLRTFGLNLLDPGNANEVLSATRIYDYTGKPYTVKYLVDLLKIDKNQIYNSYDPNAQMDVLIVLGNDWAFNNSMP